MAALAVLGGSRSKTAVNQNVEPTPGRLSTPMSPSMRRTSSREIARPKPVPPYLRVVEPSAWLNARNKRSRISSGMPMPVSMTSNRNATLPEPAGALGCWPSAVT